MRKKMMAGNWKMNLQISGLDSYFKTFATSLDEPPTTLPSLVDVVFAAPYTMLAAVKQHVQKLRCQVAAQNVHWEEVGAFTGEISAAMLKEVGVGVSLVGHSERRQFFGETDDTVARRARAALNAGITPIVCIGETLEERRGNATEAVLERQLLALKDLFPDLERLVVAYEPVWAIGTGQTATPEQAEEAHAFIRAVLKRHSEAAERVQILYGGSAKASNIADLMAKPNIDGALVGGASLKPEEFAAMVNTALKYAKRSL